MLLLREKDSYLILSSCKLEEPVTFVDILCGQYLYSLDTSALSNFFVHVMQRKLKTAAFSQFFEHESLTLKLVSVYSLVECKIHCF